MLDTYIRDLVRDEVARSRSETATPSESEPAYMLTSEAAEFARVSTGTIRRWCDQGKLEKRKVNGRIRVARDQVIALMGAPRIRRTKEGELPDESPEKMAWRAIGMLPGRDIS